MNTKAIAAFSVAGLAMAAFSIWEISRRPGQGHNNSPLEIYCAAGLKKPVTEITKNFQNEIGAEVQIQFGGSGTLLANIKTSQRGDLLLSADETTVDHAQKAGLIRERMELVRFTPVIAVRKNAPQEPKSLEEMVSGNFKLGLGNPEAAAIGVTSKKILENLGLWDKAKAEVENKGVFKPTVNDLANDLKIGAIDVAIIWDATVAQYPELKAIRLPILDSARQTSTLAVLASAKNPTATLAFARYLTAKDRGLTVFAKMGYDTLSGDSWSLKPQVTLFSGSMLRPAIESRVKAFENREGCTVNRVYNGCGILVSQMRAGNKPDAYFSCDIKFMNQVQDLFVPALNISQNRLVIMVQKGNPKAINSLADLTKPGLRIGLGHPEKAALGALTANMIEANHLTKKLQDSKNVKVESATGDLLVNQLRTESLDATIVYISNASEVADAVDIISIPDSSAIAIQPFSISKATGNKMLMQRFLLALLDTASQKSFESHGFKWIDKK